MRIGSISVFGVGVLRKIFSYLQNAFLLLPLGFVHSNTDFVLHREKEEKQKN